MWEMIAGLGLETHIPVIACPTLVLAGAMDSKVPVAAGQRIADAILGASLHAFPDVGHLPPLEAPRAFNDLLRAHLVHSESGFENCFDDHASLKTRV